MHKFYTCSLVSDVSTTKVWVSFSTTCVFFHSLSPDLSACVLTITCIFTVLSLQVALLDLVSLGPALHALTSFFYRCSYSDVSTTKVCRYGKVQVWVRFALLPSPSLLTSLSPHSFPSLFLSLSKYISLCCVQKCIKPGDP